MFLLQDPLEVKELIRSSDLTWPLLGMISRFVAFLYMYLTWVSRGQRKLSDGSKTIVHIIGQTE